MDTCRLILDQMKTVLLFQRLLHGDRIERLVALQPDRPNGRPLARVELARLDRCHICDARHRPAQGIDLSDDLRLPGPTD
jgi:hypothetical protein